MQEFAVIVCSGFDNKGLAGWSLQEEGNSEEIWESSGRRVANKVSNRTFVDFCSNEIVQLYV